MPDELERARRDRLARDVWRVFGQTDRVPISRGVPLINPGLPLPGERWPGLPIPGSGPGDLPPRIPPGRDIPDIPRVPGRTFPRIGGWGRFAGWGGVLIEAAVILSDIILRRQDRQIVDRMRETDRVIAAEIERRRRERELTPPTTEPFVGPRPRVRRGARIGSRETVLSGRVPEITGIEAGGRIPRPNPPPRVPPPPIFSPEIPPPQPTVPSSPPPRPAEPVFRPEIPQPTIPTPRVPEPARPSDPSTTPAPAPAPPAPSPAPPRPAPGAPVPSPAPPTTWPGFPWPSPTIGIPGGIRWPGTSRPAVPSIAPPRPITPPRIPDLTPPQLDVPTLTATATGVGIRTPTRTGTQNCEVVKRRRRKKGKCREGYFRETENDTKYVTWRTRDCASKKVTSRSKK